LIYSNTVSANAIHGSAPNNAALKLTSTSQVEAVVESKKAGQEINQMIAYAESLIGKVHYKFGVNDYKKLIFDCSSYTKYVFASVGVKLIM